MARVDQLRDAVCGRDMATQAFGAFLTMAFSLFREHLAPGYHVTDEAIRWEERPYPEIRLVVVATGDAAKRYSVDWKALRIWETNRDGFHEIHVSDGKGRKLSTAHDRYDNVLAAAAKLMASHANAEIAKMT
jgi:hypothetical protein